MGLVCRQQRAQFQRRAGRHGIEWQADSGPLGVTINASGGAGFAKGLPSVQPGDSDRREGFCPWLGCARAPRDLLGAVHKSTGWPDGSVKAGSGASAGVGKGRQSRAIFAVRSGAGSSIPKPTHSANGLRLIGSPGATQL